MTEATVDRFVQRIQTRRAVQPRGTPLVRRHIRVRRRHVIAIIPRFARLAHALPRFGEDAGTAIIRIDGVGSAAGTPGTVNAVVLVFGR